MYILINNFNINNVFLDEKQDNNVLYGSDFYRLQYSDENITLNSIYLKVNLKNVKFGKYFNKLKCNFKKEDNEQTLIELNSIEKIIIDKYKNILKKKPKYIIMDQIKQNFIKIFIDNKSINYEKITEINLILKISGIWADKNNFGLTFRVLIPV
jgi:hypothetical protein